MHRQSGVLLIELKLNSAALLEACLNFDGRLKSRPMSGLFVVYPQGMRQGGPCHGLWPAMQTKCEWLQAGAHVDCDVCFSTCEYMSVARLPVTAAGEEGWHTMSAPFAITFCTLRWSCLTA